MADFQHLTDQLNQLQSAIQTEMGEVQTKLDEIAALLALSDYAQGETACSN